MDSQRLTCKIWLSEIASAAFLIFVLAPSAAGGVGVAVGPQYDTTHVYIAHGDLDAFVNSFAATFGGKPSQRTVGNVSPVASSTEMQSVRTPAGALSVFAYQTPVPFPFGLERTGYLVGDMDQAIKDARAAGAEVIVEPFKDPIGIDAVIQWPGGVKMQLYWHFKPSTNPPLETIPDNRSTCRAIRPITSSGLSYSSPTARSSQMTDKPTRAKSDAEARLTAGSLFRHCSATCESL
jgi:hypothetical protein